MGNDIVMLVLQVLESTTHATVKKAWMGEHDGKQSWISQDRRMLRVSGRNHGCMLEHCLGHLARPSFWGHVHAHKELCTGCPGIFSSSEL